MFVSYEREKRWTGGCPSRCEGLDASHELGPAESADEEEGWLMGIRFLLAEQRKTLIQFQIFKQGKSASIMASATASTAVPGTSTSALEERGVGGLRRHAGLRQRFV